MFVKSAGLFMITVDKRGYKVVTWLRKLTDDDKELIMEWTGKEKLNTG